VDLGTLRARHPRRLSALGRPPIPATRAKIASADPFNHVFDRRGGSREGRKHGEVDHEDGRSEFEWKSTLLRARARRRFH
jgi:hypothetical protein